MFHSSNIVLKSIDIILITIYETCMFNVTCKYTIL
jgi:hypothetical protein